MATIPESFTTIRDQYEKGSYQSHIYRTKKDIDKACTEGHRVLIQGFRGEISLYYVMIVGALSLPAFLMAYFLDPENALRNLLVLILISVGFMLALWKFGSRKQREAMKYLLIVGPEGVLGYIQTVKETNRGPRLLFEDRFLRWSQVTDMKESLELISGMPGQATRQTYEIKHRRKQKDEIIEEIAKHRMYLWKFVINPRTEQEIPFDITHIRRGEFPEPHHEFLVAHLIYTYWKEGRGKKQ